MTNMQSWDTRHILAITERVIEVEPDDPYTVDDCVACVLQLANVIVTIEGPNGEDKITFRRISK